MENLNFIGVPVEDTIEPLHKAHLDITAPHTVELQVRETAGIPTVWVNVSGGVCVFRACRMTNIVYHTKGHDQEVRQSLVASLTLVALHGLEQERMTASRIRNPNADYTQDAEVREVRRVVQFLKSGKAVHTQDGGAYWA